MTQRERQKINSQRWRKANAEKNRANGRAYYAKNRAHILHRKKKWRDANRLRLNALQNLRNAKNRERVNALKRARRKRLGYTDTDRAEKRRYYVRHSAEIKRKMLQRYYATKSDPAKYAELRSKKRENLREWRRRNPEKTLAAVYRYIKKYPETMRKKYHARYIRKKGWKLVGSHTVKQWLSRVQFYGWRCVYCGVMLNKNTLTKDHRIPLSRGGTEFPSNLAPACLSCNSRKGNRPHKKG